MDKAVFRQVQKALLVNLTQLAMNIFALKAKAFEEATKNPISHQKKLLLEYLTRNKNTEYGKIHDFSSVRSIQDYQSKVPLTDSTALYQYVERLKNGENNILTADKVVFFATTTGTTAKPKLIPETNYSRSKKVNAIDIWGYYISRDHPKVFDGKILAIISPEIEGITKAGIPCGAESGHSYKNLPGVIKHQYSLPYEVFEIKDCESRYYTILRISMGQNITNIATLNPSTILLLCQKITNWQNRIIQDIASGTLYDGLAIEPDARKAIEKILNPNPKRAEELKNILREKGELVPKNFWPDIEVIECWKGGAVKLYLKELPRYFGNILVRDFGCLSSEARSSITMSDDGAGGVLAIDTNFYEFIPKEEFDKENRRALLCDSLETGKEYYLIVTTAGGLYRYNIDDVVKVDGYFNKTPIIEFVQKGLNAVSLTGEKLYETHVIEAFNAALDKTRLMVAFLCGSVQWEKTPRYIFLVEFHEDPDDSVKELLLRTIEEGLYSQNEEYALMRHSQQLASPILKIVKKGGFERYRNKRVSGGAHDGQFKLPELIADLNFQKNFEIVEEIKLLKDVCYTGTR